MKKITFLGFVFALNLALFSCAPSQAELLTQTSVAETATAVSWTETPTPAPTKTETPTFTLDPCLPVSLKAAVREVDKLQIRFDSLSGYAAILPKEEVPTKMDEIKELFQTALEQEVPPCLGMLKEYQLRHMELVIQTLEDFVNGGNNKKVLEGITRAREEHDQYVNEKSRLLGIATTPTP